MYPLSVHRCELIEVALTGGIVVIIRNGRP